MLFYTTINNYFMSIQLIKSHVLLPLLLSVSMAGSSSCKKKNDGTPGSGPPLDSTIQSTVTIERSAIFFNPSMVCFCLLKSASCETVAVAGG